MEIRCAGCGAEKVGGAWRSCDRPNAEGTSHGTCNPCIRRLYPETAERIIARLKEAN